MTLLWEKARTKVPVGQKWEARFSCSDWFFSRKYRLISSEFGEQYLFWEYEGIYSHWFSPHLLVFGSSGVWKLLSCKHSKVFVQQRESQLPRAASGCGKMQIAAVHRDRYIQQSPCSCSVCLGGVQAAPCAGSLMDTVPVQGMILAIWTEIYAVLQQLKCLWAIATLPYRQSDKTSSPLCSM